MDDDAKRHLQDAQSCLESGQHEKAWDELEKIPADLRESEEVTLLQLAVQIAMENWKAAAKIARQAVKIHSDCSDIYIAGAYALRRTRNVRAARRFLTEGQLTMEENGLYWFDLACYNCQLGEIDRAKDCLMRATGIDERFRELALRDPDLEAMRDLIEAEWDPARRRPRKRRS